MYLNLIIIQERCKKLHNWHHFYISLQVIENYKDFAFSDYARVGRALALYEVGDREEAIAEMEDVSISLKGYPGISEDIHSWNMWEEKHFWSVIVLMFSRAFCRSSCSSSSSLICGQACSTASWKPIHYCNSTWSSVYRRFICKRNKALASKFGQFFATLHQPFLGICIISYTTCYQLGHTVMTTFGFFGHFYFRWSFKKKKWISWYCIT